MVVFTLFHVDPPRPQLSVDGRLAIDLAQNYDYEPSGADTHKISPNQWVSIEKIKIFLNVVFAAFAQKRV